ncbi:MAG: hypothetical protein KAR38_09105, partial [Calditrichia bacterium]|nr:hypothetical protein [Calditrichia bacterium]
MHYVITANQLQTILMLKPGSKNKYKLNLGLAPVVVEIKKDVVIFNETTIPVKEIKKTRLEEDSLYLIDH